jgi:hypothetical protein
MISTNGPNDTPKEKGDYNIGGTTIIPREPPKEPGCVITKQDFFLLQEGSTSRLSTTRDIAIGAAVSGLVGFASLWATLPEKQSPASGLTGMPLFSFVALAVLSFGGLALAIITYILGKNDVKRQSFKCCFERIMTQLHITEEGK